MECTTDHESEKKPQNKIIASTAGQWNDGEKE